MEGMLSWLMLMVFTVWLMGLTSWLGWKVRCLSQEQAERTEAHFHRFGRLHVEIVRAAMAWYYAEMGSKAEKAATVELAEVCSRYAIEVREIQR